MKLIDRLEKTFGNFAISNLTRYLILGQVIFFIAIKLKYLSFENIIFTANHFQAGQYWRMITFLFVPLTDSIIFSFFVWYLYFLLGSSLEEQWGTFKYNLYILISYILSIGVAFIIPYMPITNHFIYASVFLAFAHLYPDFQLYIFFLLPVKIRWLAIITWIGYGYTLIKGPWLIRFTVFASIFNYLLFFGKDILLNLRYGRRKMNQQFKNIRTQEEKFRHECYICGKTDISAPDMTFRYCSKCNPPTCYCNNHIHHNKHI